MDRIAIVFDNRPRRETTGVYCRRALGQLMSQGAGVTDLEHLLPDELAEIPAGRFDLFVFVDDGLPYAIPPNCQPSAWWAIDTHLDWERCYQNALTATWTFAAQRDGADRLREAGIRDAQWLPLACDPQLHRMQPVSKQFDIGFIGNVFPGPRKELLETLRLRYPSALIARKYFQDMAWAYSACRIVFNRSIANDVNMRVFEALCSGSLLITNDLSENGLSELFRDGTELVTYSDSGDLLERIDHYLKSEVERERIASRGRSAVLNGHTYRHRMETMLRHIRSMAPSRNATVFVNGAGRSAPSYFEFDRPEVQELVPRESRRVLDVGCGAGRLGLGLKRRMQVHVSGIELDPAVAEIAARRLDSVRCGSVEDESIDFPDATFDCVICADVLEHLRHPETVLRRIRRWLTPDGSLVTSLPNVRNQTVIRSLLAGNWTYESAGLLDQDHVRFFTRREIEKLLWRTGFEVEALQMTPGEGFDEWVKKGHPAQVKLGGLQVDARTPENAAEFLAYQYVARSRPRTVVDRGVTSIILVTHNQLDYTQLCLDSIRLRTDEPIEWIFVDNGSTDGTTEYLRGLGLGTVISNAENRGFPASVNQGLNVARGNQILLLNNDTIVTTGWLSRLLEALYSGPSIGLVGPVSNRVSGEQQIPVDYAHLNEIDGFAWDWSRDHRGERHLTDRLVGFCLLFRRAVVGAIGGLDERFGIGNFEDDDFCRRAGKAGFEAVIAVDSFVHHFGGTTFRASGVDFAAVMAENKRRYDEKWHSEPPSAKPEDQVPAQSASPTPARGKARPRFLARRVEEPGLFLEPNTVRLSVCLIVRDNETTIGPCLESIRPWVDEIVVVDTGSADATPRICEELGARVVHWAWRDDFSAARNVSLDHALGEWLFWMDSDDTIPQECGRKLRELVDGDHPDEVFGYVMQVHCPGPDPARRDLTVVDHVKLFRNLPELRFEHRIHEQILPAIRRAGGDVVFTDIYVVHSGSDHSTEGRKRKLERDFRLLGLDLAERSDHPFVLFNLGMTHADAGNDEEAVGWLRRCLERSSSGESHVRKTYALLIASLARLGRTEEAARECGSARVKFPDDVELLFRDAMLAHERGDLDDAAELYRQLLNPSRERHFSSRDADLTGTKAWHNLAIVYEQMPRWDLAKAAWETILTECFDYLPARVGVLECRLRLDDLDNLDEALSALQRESEGLVHAVRLQALAFERRGDRAAAIRHLRDSPDAIADDLGILTELARMRYLGGELEEACVVLQRLTNAYPEHVAGWNNLATVLLELGRREEAESARRSITKLMSRLRK